jgi:hypothetical protein
MDSVTLAVATPAHALYNFGTMISERLAKLESMLRGNPNLSEPSRQELLELVAGLRAEVTPLEDTHAESASQIAGSAEAAVHASINRDEQPEQATVAVEGLAASVREFEASHPRLVEIVDQLTVTLSNMGI